MKMSFREWLASQETEDQSITFEWFNYWDKLLPILVSKDMTESHHGDCTKTPGPCSLCTLERLLSEYREYFFDIERNDNE